MCRQVVIWHKAFCAEYHTDTFRILLDLLTSFKTSNVTSRGTPFPNRLELDKFVMRIVQILSSHFTLGNASGKTNKDDDGPLGNRLKVDLEKALYS